MLEYVRDRGESHHDGTHRDTHSQSELMKPESWSPSTTTRLHPLFISLPLSVSHTHLLFFYTLGPGLCLKLSGINTLKPLCHETEWNACQRIAGLTSFDRRLPFSIPAGENQMQREKERGEENSISLFNLSAYPSTQQQSLHTHTHTFSRGTVRSLGSQWMSVCLSYSLAPTAVWSLTEGGGGGGGWMMRLPVSLSLSVGLSVWLTVGPRTYKVPVVQNLHLDPLIYLKIH